MQYAMIQNGNGLGAGAGEGMSFSDFTSSLATGLDPIVQDIVAELRPHLMSVAKEASEIAAPHMRTIVREEVMPKLMTYIILGLVGAGAVGAATAVLLMKRGGR